MLENSKGPPSHMPGAPMVQLLVQLLVFFGYCKRILDSLKPICYFWALDMAPTYADPGLFFKEWKTVKLRVRSPLQLKDATAEQAL